MFLRRLRAERESSANRQATGMFGGRRAKKKEKREKGFYAFRQFKFRLYAHDACDSRVHGSGTQVKNGGSETELWNGEETMVDTGEPGIGLRTQERGRGRTERKQKLSVAGTMGLCRSQRALTLVLRRTISWPSLASASFDG
jgi:hypothetical protein